MTTLQAQNALRTRGMRDLLPAEMRAFRRAEDAFRGAAARWGYSELRTPTIEPYRLFTMSGSLTPQMLSRVYSFLDWDGWSGERVVLRPDSTIPVARTVSERAVDLPARLSYVQNVFRFHEDESERETWQFGVEYFGAPAILGDVEVILVACEALGELGLEPVVRLSHAGIARGIAERIADGDEGEARILLEAVLEDGLAPLARQAAAAGIGPFVEAAAAGAGGPALVENLKALAGPALTDVIAALEEVAAVGGALVSSGQAVEIAPSMVGDFEYYTGPIVEILASGKECGTGGRYRAFGVEQRTTAFGIALDSGELTSLLRVSTREPLVIAIMPREAGFVARALEIARELHLSGIAATLGDSGLGNRLTVHVGEQLDVDGPEGTRRIEHLGDLVSLLVGLK